VVILVGMNSRDIISSARLTCSSLRWLLRRFVNGHIGLWSWCRVAVTVVTASPGAEQNSLIAQPF